MAFILFKKFNSSCRKKIPKFFKNFFIECHFSAKMPKRHRQHTVIDGAVDFIIRMSKKTSELRSGEHVTGISLSVPFMADQPFNAFFFNIFFRYPCAREKLSILRTVCVNEHFPALLVFLFCNIVLAGEQCGDRHSGVASLFFLSKNSLPQSYRKCHRLFRQKNEIMFVGIAVWLPQHLPPQWHNILTGSAANFHFAADLFSCVKKAAPGSN